MVARALRSFFFVAPATVALQASFAQQAQYGFETFEPGPVPQGEWITSGQVSVTKPGLDYIGPFGGFKEGGSRALELTSALTAPAEAQVALTAHSEWTLLSLVVDAADESAALELRLGDEEAGLDIVLDFEDQSVVINGAQFDVPELSGASSHQIVFGLQSESGTSGAISLWVNPSEVDEGRPSAVVDGLSSSVVSAEQLVILARVGTVRVDTVETSTDFTSLVPSASSPGHLVINGSAVADGESSFPADGGSITVDNAAEIYAGNEKVEIESKAAPNHIFRYLEVVSNGRAQIYYDPIVTLSINGDAEIHAEFGVIHKSAAFATEGSMSTPETAGNGMTADQFNAVLAAAHSAGAGGATGFDQPQFSEPLTLEYDPAAGTVPSGEALDLQLRIGEDRVISIQNGSRTNLEALDQYGRPSPVYRKGLRWDGAVRFPLSSGTNDYASDGVALNGANTYEVIFDPADEITAAGLVLLLEQNGMGEVMEEFEPLLQVSANLTDGSHIDLEYDPDTPIGIHHEFYGFEAPEGLAITSIIVETQCGRNACPSVAIDSLGVVSGIQDGVKVETAAQGDGQVTGAGEYPSGAEVSLSAMPANGNVLLGWSNGLQENPLLVTQSESATYTARFGPAPQAGGRFTAAFSSDGAGGLLAESDVEWLKAGVVESEKVLVLELEVLPNPEADARTAVVEVRDGDEVLLVHAVKQEGLAREILGEEAEAAGPGWAGTMYHTSWIGEIEVASHGGQLFLRTNAHGWWYVINDHDALWAFDFESNQWMWINPSSWPTVYNASAGWMTWSGTTSPRWFFSYLLNDWVTLEQI